MDTYRDTAARRASETDGRKMSRRIETIKATPRQMGATEIRIPDERGYRTRARRGREGIDIDKKIYRALGHLAEGRLDQGG